jgi:hypothetical protein
MPSQQLRAACLSVLPIAAPKNSELVLSKLDLLEQAGCTDWWEVHAQLVVVYASLLDILDSEHPQVKQVYDLLQKTVEKCSTPDVLKIALCHLAPSLSVHPSISQLYAKMLFDIPSVMLSSTLSSNATGPGLLNDAKPHTLSLPSDMPVNHYRLIYLPSEWHSVTVASGVAKEIHHRELVQLELKHLEILLSCLQSGISPDDKISWTAVFSELNKFLYVALCDVDVCTVAIEVLRVFFENLQSDDIKLTFETMTKSLSLLYPNGDEFCRGAVAGFLTDVMRMHNNSYKDNLFALLEALPDDVKAAPELAGCM